MTNLTLRQHRHLSCTVKENLKFRYNNSQIIDLKLLSVQLLTEFQTTFSTYRSAMPFGNRKKNILGDLFSSVLVIIQKISPL